MNRPSLPFRKPGITGKLSLAILGVCFLTALAMGMATRISFKEGFSEYLLEIEETRVSLLVVELEEEYRQRGDWDFAKDAKRWRRFLFRFSRPGDEERLKEAGAAHIRDTLTVAERTRRLWENAHLRSTLGLLEADGTTLVAGHRPVHDAIWLPLRVGDKIVGWLTREPIDIISDTVDERFHEKQLTAIIVIMAVSMGISAVAALLTARTLIAPIKRLAATSNRLAAGDFSARVTPAPPPGADLSGNPAQYDELMIFSGQFNQMAAVLEANERARRAFMAEIAHDLRTPLAVLRGELEALEDGVRPLNKEALASLSSEVELLGRLVEDIQTLALADLGRLVYQKKNLDLGICLSQVLSAYEERIRAAGLTLDLNLPDRELPVFVDPARLTQVLRNVLENSLRYTDRGGGIEVSCREEPGWAVVHVSDTPPGVPEAELPLLFERFHTGDSARNRKHSGSGLGLAICRTLMEAQGGRIEALPSPLGGVLVRVQLPLRRTAGGAQAKPVRGERA